MQAGYFLTQKVILKGRYIYIYIYIYGYTLVEFCTPNQISALKIFRINIRAKSGPLVTPPCNVLFVDRQVLVAGWKFVRVVEHTPCNEATGNNRLVIFCLVFGKTIRCFPLCCLTPQLLVVSTLNISAKFSQIGISIKSSRQFEHYHCFGDELHRSVKSPWLLWFFLVKIGKIIRWSWTILVFNNLYMTCN